MGELTDDDMLDIMAAQWDWAFEQAGIPEVLRAQESSTRAPRGPHACPERARNGRHGRVTRYGPSCGHLGDIVEEARKTEAAFPHFCSWEDEANAPGTIVGTSCLRFPGLLHDVPKRA